MTVQSSTASASYQGNGVTTQFTVPFYFLDPTHVKVLRSDSVTSPPTVATLVLNSDYVVTGAGVASGGAITCTTAPTATQKLILLRNVPFTQLIHYVPNDPFPAATHEQALDQLTMEVQQLGQIQNNSLQTPVYETPQPALLPASQRASQFLGFDANGNIAYLPLPASIGAGDLRIEEWTDGVGYTSGTSTSVTLSRTYGTKANLGSVIMQGIAQDPNSYTLSGTTLTFNAVIPLGVSPIWCTGGTTLSLNTPAIGSVVDTSVGAGSKLFNRINDMLSVKDFGAVGNGVADDTAFIQNADNAAAAAGKNLYFPAGTYLINTAGIAKQSGVSWFGAGKVLSVLKAITATWANSLVSGGTLTGVSMFHLGFDGTGMTSTGLPSQFAAGSFSNGEVAFCDFKNILSIGILFGGGSNFSIHHNTFSRPAALATLNEAVWITRTTSLPVKYSVKDNIFTNIGTDFDGNDVIVSGNTVTGWGYGAGITVEQGASRFQMETNNCSSGVGVDMNGVFPMGIENWASFSTIIGNITNFNSGCGIMQGGPGCVVANNTGINNGQNAAGGLIYRCGIASRYVNATFNAGSSVYTGNNFTDTGGGTQLYGYVDDGVNNSGITLADNIFFGATAPMNATGTRYDFKGPKLTLTRTNVAGFTATTMTSGGGEAGVALSGAQIGDKVTVSISSTNMQGLMGVGWVPAAGQVSYSFFNPTGGSITVPIFTASISVEKPFSYTNY